ncbi:MAG: hypothetical protein KW806_02980 [Candidatus Yanofskybacteria bacterium]|nr:hypothetical protein [Candidatus Yanofskybacteria bacterium]
MDQSVPLEPSAKRSIPILKVGLVLVFILVAFLVWFNFFKLQPKSNLETVKAILLKDAKIKVPEIKIPHYIALSEFPQDLKIFLLSDAENLSVHKIDYADGKTGYLAEYEIKSSPTVVNQNLSLQRQNNPEWVLVGGSRADIFGFFESENKNYRVHIEESQLNKTSAYVVVYVLNK